MSTAFATRMPADSPVGATIHGLHATITPGRNDTLAQHDTLRGSLAAMR